MDTLHNMPAASFTVLRSRAFSVDHARQIACQFVGFTSDMRPVFRTMYGAQVASRDKIAIQIKKDETNKVSGFAPNSW